jgi:hypothetical protein
MADLHTWAENTRTVACAVQLQLHGGIDPDASRGLSERIVRAVDRAAARGHVDAAATDEEVRRAQSALVRRGVQASHDDVRYALNEAFVFGWGS